MGIRERARRGVWKRRVATRIRVGTDLVEVSDVERSVAEFGDRYLERVYTPREIARCSASGTPNCRSLAARFAAKEAVVKALRPSGGVAYTDLEIVTDSTGAPVMSFTGSVERLVQTLGLISSSLSLSHDGSYATAVYVALTRDHHETSL